MRGKNWSGKPIFQKGKDFPCSAIDIFFSDLVKYVSTDNSYSFLTSVAVHEQNLYEYYRVDIFWDQEINDYTVQKTKLAIFASGKLSNCWEKH